MSANLGCPTMAISGRVAAAAKLTDWSQANASLWTHYFTSTKLSLDGLGGLAVVSSPQEDDMHRKKVEPLSAASFPNPNPAFLSAKTGTTGVALRLRTSSDTSVYSVTPLATPAQTALMDGQPVPVGTSTPRIWEALST